MNLVNRTATISQTVSGGATHSGTLNFSGTIVSLLHFDMSATYGSTYYPTKNGDSGYYYSIAGMRFSGSLLTVLVRIYSGSSIAWTVRLFGSAIVS